VNNFSEKHRYPRTSQEKGLDRAIAIARASGMKLKIAAKVYFAERGYFHQTIEPLLPWELSNGVSWPIRLNELARRNILPPLNARYPRLACIWRYLTGS